MTPPKREVLVSFREDFSTIFYWEEETLKTKTIRNLALYQNKFLKDFFFIIFINQRKEDSTPSSALQALSLLLETELNA